MTPLRVPDALTPRRRTVLAWTALGLAILLLLVGSLTVWVKRQALDTNSWVDASSRLLEDDDVRELAAAELVDALFSGPDLEGRIRRLLPPEVQGLAGPATGLLREAALPAAEDLLARPATQRLWREANRRAHQRLLALLDGDDSGLLRSSGGDVVLDLRPLVERLGDRIGLTPALPPGAGQVTILRSERLGAAQEAVKAIRTLSVLLVVVVVVLLGVALWLAEGFRRRMLVALAAGLIGVGGVLLVVRRVAGDAIVDALTDPVTRDAGRAVWLIGTDLLRDLALALLLYGVLLLAGAWLAGPARRAVAARRRLAPVVRDHPVAIWGAGAALLLAVLVWGPSSGSRRLLGILVLAALVAAGVEALRRVILAEDVPGPPGAT
ncbi:hypothetical protein [Miltoncostaea oceani]|uniref:hypothetical protein n=1 Tax=Miltoncostaea oceani TaxID=2843216 RepID=UPI001C3C9B4E|nr:hypothetical protein [Miltoncostaea oceani]